MLSSYYVVRTKELVDGHYSYLSKELNKRYGNQPIKMSKRLILDATSPEVLKYDSYKDANKSLIQYGLTKKKFNIADYIITKVEVKTEEVAEEEPSSLITMILPKYLCTEIKREDYNITKARLTWENIYRPNKSMHYDDFELIGCEVVDSDNSDYGVDYEVILTLELKGGIK